MRELAVKSINLSKLYQIGVYQGTSDTLGEALARRLRWGRKNQKAKDRSSGKQHSFWALKDITFEIEKGDVVGIIGKNGAGKSTLLKILSRVSEPTEGYAELGGRVSSLLEVGTGFHQELTGRENIYLSGSILGMRKKEIDQRLDRIIDFSEIEEFVDTPVKHYSTGMYLRLAFAVAAHLDSEILIVDEILSVGDASFQKKCMAKIAEIIQSGTTILLVSHNLNLLSQLCTKGIYLREGRIAYAGSMIDTVNSYIVDLSRRESAIRDRKDREGDGRIRFTDMRLRNSKGEWVSALRTGEDCSIVLDFVASGEDLKNEVLVSFGMKDYFGNFVLLHQTNFNNHSFDIIRSFGSFVCHIPKLPVVAGEYFANMYVGLNGKTCDSLEQAAPIKIERGDFFGTGHPGRPELCSTLVDCRWEMN